MQYIASRLERRVQQIQELSQWSLMTKSCTLTKKKSPLFIDYLSKIYYSNDPYMDVYYAHLIKHLYMIIHLSQLNKVHM